MNKEMKRSFRIFILKILAVVFVLCICYFLYAFVYRAKTELPTKAVVTNRGAAVYTLRGQKQMLSQKEDFSYFAFDGREKEKEYGTYVIPGLKNTRTLLTKKGATPAMCTSMFSPLTLKYIADMPDLVPVVFFDALSFFLYSDRKKRLSSSS